MLNKFKKIKDRSYFYRVLADETGKDPHSIQNNWFKKLFCSVPKDCTPIAEKTIDTFIEYENELSKRTESIKIKYFGK